jgi:cofilin
LGPSFSTSPRVRDRLTVAMSGVVPTDACKREFLLLKDKRAYKFVTYKIDPEKGVVDVCECVEKTVRLE